MYIHNRKGHKEIHHKRHLGMDVIKGNFSIVIYLNIQVLDVNFLYSYNIIKLLEASLNIYICHHVNLEYIEMMVIIKIFITYF